MNITFHSDKINIQLDPTERIFGVHLSQKIEVPLETLQSVTLERPDTTWKELRAPGTYFPWLIKAGTYYSKRGRQFWYVLGDRPCLCLDMSEGYYKRIVLGSTNASSWQSQIQNQVQNQVQNSLPQSA